MIFIRFLLLLLFAYLVARTVARLLLRALGIRWFASSARPAGARPLRNDSPGAVEAEYEVIESHIGEESRKE